MLKHYVEFIYPGIFVCETNEREIESRDKLNRIPKNCFGYRFFDRKEEFINGEKLIGKEKNHSGIYYFGIKYTLKEVKKLPGDHKTLIWNMENNKYKNVVKTRCGNFQLLEKNDQIIKE